MDIFKFFFEHDLRLDQLRERHTTEEPETTLSIEDFMKPDPTYTKFYLTGTRIEEEQFGLSILNHFDEILQKLEGVFDDKDFITKEGRFSLLADALNSIKIGDAIIITDQENPSIDLKELQIGDDSNVGHFKSELANALKKGVWVLYKEKAHHGFDLHLFSQRNIKKELFYPLKELVGDSFRFFSINGKRIRSERQFYFETWTLDRPPHGAEEVLPETVL